MTHVPAGDVASGGLVPKLLRHGTAYLAGGGVLAVTGAALLPVNTRIFTRQEYGTIAAVDSVRALVEIVAGLQLFAAFRRMQVDVRHDRDALAALASTLSWSALVLGLGVACAAAAAAAVTGVGGVPAGTVLLPAFLAAALVQFGQIAAAHLQLAHRAARQMAHVIANVAVHTAVMLVLCGGLGSGLPGKYAAVLAGAAVFAALGAAVLRREGLLRATFSWPLAREAFAFSLPLLPGVLAMWATTEADRLFVAGWRSAEEAGVYQTGALVGRGASVLSQAVLLVYMPMLYAWLRDDAERARSHLARFVPAFLALMVAAGLALALFAGDLLALLVPREFEGGASVAAILAAAQALGAVGSLLSIVLAFHRRTGLVGAGLVLQAAIGAGASAVLVPAIGRTGAAWGALAAAACSLLFWAACTARTFPVRVGRLRIAAVLIVAAGAAAAGAAAAPWGVAAKAAVLVVALALLLSPPCTPRDELRRLLRR